MIKPLLRPLALCVAFIFIISPAVRAQYGSNTEISSELRQGYLIRTYGLSYDQVRAYEKLLRDKAAREDAIKKAVIPSSQFETQAKAAFATFSQKVGQVFTQAQYAQWRENTNDSEWYRYLGEELQIPAGQLLRQRQMTKAYSDRRKEIWSSPMDEKERYKFDAENMASFRTRTAEILGTMSAKYLYERSAQSSSVKNMDKYNVSYNVARQIAETDLAYQRRKDEVRASDLRGQQRTDAFERNERDREEALAKALSKDVAERHLYALNHPVEYKLKSKYHLSASQITEYKEQWNRFAIAEYKVLNSHAQDKSAQWDAANQAFCQAVQPLFSAEDYTRWLGKRMFDFEQAKEKRAKRNKK